MKKLFSFLISICFMVTFMAAPSQTFAANDSEYITAKVKGKYYQSEALKVYDMVNAKREEQGLKKLKWDTVLEKAAIQRAIESSVRFSHTRPDDTSWENVNGGAMMERFYGAGENLAAGSRNAKEAMDGWMNSSGHRANILNSDYTHIGIACVAVNGVKYWVQSFGMGDKGQTGKTDVSGTFSRSVKMKKSSTKFIMTSSDAKWSENLKKVTKVRVKKSHKIKVVAYHNSDNFVPAKLSYGQFTFKSSNKKILKVSSKGKLTGVKKGKATITATLKSNKNFKIKAKIKVY